MRQKASKFLVFQFKKEGSEVVTESVNGRNRIERVNPLHRLCKNGHLSQKEYAIALRYQADFGEANKSCYTKPTIYQGLPHSSVLSNESELSREDKQVRAAIRIEKIKREILAHSRPRQISGFKDFKNPRAQKSSRDLRLLEILEKVFEQEKSINVTEKELGIHYSLLNDRVKLICGIMLKILN